MDAGTSPPTQGSMTVEKIKHVIEGADLRAESAVRSRFEGFRAYLRVLEGSRSILRATLRVLEGIQRVRRVQNEYVLEASNTLLALMDTRGYPSRYSGY
jgi:hypothetical protein